jgi:ABC-type multidrug transport system fused ATPase/permease subunit
MEAMERLMQGRTSFLIAHRLSTLAGCDIRLNVRGGALARDPGFVRDDYARAGGP